MSEKKQQDQATIPVHESVSKGAHVSSMEEYKTMYERSISDNEAFWAEQARKNLTWFRDFDTVRSGGLEHGDHAWFLNGRINVAYNCIDRHMEKRADQVAIIWEGDNPEDVRKITYRELLREVCRFANALKRKGVRKGDNVCIYMPMVPEAAYAMLACARLGAPHSVVFAGFSADALRDRIQDGSCRYVITADQGVRNGKLIELKHTVDRALLECPDVSTVIVYQRTGSKDVTMKDGRDHWWHDVVKAERPYCAAESLDSEDTLFMLFTSGSTGRPKGIQHTQAGYLLYTSMTHKYVFDYRDGDVYACVADVGWITGHSYIVYGPLCNGATTLMFESVPTFPDAGRYWAMVERHKITQFYTAPTAIRLLMKYSEDFVTKYDRSSLRVIGSVGEPINPEAWLWYHRVVGDSRCSVVDTYWQTETGGIMVTSLPGATPMKPGSATFPFFGIELVVRTAEGEELQGNDVQGVLCVARPWPSMARTIYGNHERFMNVYLTAYKNNYFTGDGCIRDKDGYYHITGRVDDVVNTSGHRIGSAEVESALVAHDSVAEAAVIGVPDDLKGQALFAFVICKMGIEPSTELSTELKAQVRTHIGGFAKPKHVVVVPGLPKTRSGKIMRRLLRKIACNETKPEQLGDVSTLADSTIVDKLIAAVAEQTK